MRQLLLVALALSSTPAFADGEIRVDVAVGGKKEVLVEHARGWFCDDPSLVTVDMVTRDDRNYWVVTGAKAGTTNCRVGTDLHTVHYVFEVHVAAAKKR